MKVHELGPAQNLLEAVHDEAILPIDLIAVLALRPARFSVSSGLLAAAGFFIIGIFPAA